jgi:protein-S-isoprenylcysteine O-methyltransferase Ste14
VQFFFDLVISIVGVAVVGQYSWSLRAHFSSQRLPVGTILISIVVVITTFAFLYLQWALVQPLPAVLAGFLVQLAGLALFWAAIFASREARLRLAFDAENPDSLVTSGPYKYLRHPFYTSYLVFWAGWAIALWTPWTLLFLAVILAIYTHAARGEERKFSNSPLAGQYEEYRRRTGFFWPRMRA